MKRLVLPFLFCALFYSSGLIAQTDANLALAQSSYSKNDYQQAETYYSRYIESFDSKLGAYLKTMVSYDTASVYNKSSMFPEFSVNHTLAVAFYERGMCNLNLNQPEKASKDFETSIKIDPQYAEPYLQKGLLIKGKDKTEACIYISKARWLSDTNRITKAAYRDNFCWMCGFESYQKGKNQVDLKQFAEGLQSLNNAIKFCHDSANYYAYRGIAYEGLGKTDSALADYSNAIKLDSNSYVGYYRRGLTYEEGQKYKEAFDDFTKVLLLNPKSADAYLHSAEDCENLDMESNAIYDYKQLLRLKPNEGIAWYKLGLYKKKSGDEACDYFQKALDLGVDDAQSDVDECNKEAARKNLK